MKTDVVEHLQQQWHACYKEKEALSVEVQRLKEELSVLQRKQKIALENAYVAGYEAGRADAHKGL